LTVGDNLVLVSVCMHADEFDERVA